MRLSRTEFYEPCQLLIYSWNAQNRLLLNVVDWLIFSPVNYILTSSLHHSIANTLLIILSFNILIFLHWYNENFPIFFYNEVIEIQLSEQLWRAWAPFKSLPFSFIVEWFKLFYPVSSHVLIGLENSDLATQYISFKWET